MNGNRRIRRAVSPPATPHRAPVTARVTCKRPESHRIEVELRIPGLPEAGTRELMMPRWIPGSYTLRDYARFVHDLEITTRDDRALPTTRSENDRWRFHDPGRGPLTVRYTVYCRDLSVNTSHVTRTHLYLHGVTVFLYDADTRDRPWHLKLDLPKGWEIWTGLEEPRRSGPWPTRQHGTGRYRAADYDQLVDRPIEAGVDHHEERFMAAGKPHRFVTWNPPDGTDWDTLKNDVTRIIEEACAVFDGPPYKDYTFILHIARDHGGGLEHDNSTVLGADPLALIDEKAYHTRLLPLVAHEYVHVWNVRRNKPAVFQPYDYQQEVPTGLLWLFEGGTTYYEFPLLLRAGIKKKRVYEVLAEIIKHVESTPGRHRLSVADASRLSWTKLYKRHESNPNTNVSYYAKGTLVCLLLDAHLRENGANLDQVMRHLYREHGRQGIGIEEDSVARHVLEATGVDVTRQLSRWVNHPGNVDVDKALRSLGLKLERKHSDPDQKNGLGVILDEKNLKILAVPDQWDTPDGGYRKDAALRPSPLDPDDEILAVDGWKVDRQNLARHVNTAARKKSAQVSVFRDGRLQTLEVPLWEKNPDQYKISEDKEAEADAKQRRAGWKRKRRRQQ